MRFADWEAARQRCHEIKWEALNNLDRYLLEFEAAREGTRRHTFSGPKIPTEACHYITELASSRGVHKVVKSKSMVTEEIHLTPALEKAGVQVVRDGPRRIHRPVARRAALPHRHARDASHAQRHRRPLQREIGRCGQRTTPRNWSPSLAARCAAISFPAKWESAARIFSSLIRE